MVDEGRIGRLLRGVVDRVERLDQARAQPVDQRSSLWLDGVKYLFVTAIEGCVDVAHHIGSSEGFAPPDSNAGAVRLLGEHGVVDADLATRIARAVGFRNVLVHRYAEVDDDLVVGALDRLADFRCFAAQVGGWVLAQGRDEGSDA